MFYGIKVQKKIYLVFILTKMFKKN